MQIVGYEIGVEDGSESALVVSDGGVLVREPLSPGRDLAYTLGERRCAGTIDGVEHRSCDRTSAPYCDQHETTWVCARCTGTCLKAEMDCYQEHAIYVAAFAPATFKVGVTRRSDPTERLREQGADRGAIIRRVPDGRIAREIEADIAATTPIPDSVRVRTKIQGLGRSVDENAWNRLLESFEVETTYAFDYGLDLDSTPVAERIASGTVVGTKGRVLVLERSTGRFAVDLKQLVGHEIEAGDTARELQSDLGSFG